MSKFVIAICTLCVLVVVSAWIMGGETGKYSTSISIDASPGDVFPYLTDGDKISKWASDVLSIDSFTEDDSIIRKRVVEGEDENVVWEDSILRFQRDPEDKEYSISIQSRNGGFVNTYFFHLKENEVDGTNVEYRVTQSASGIDRFLFPLRKDDTKSKITSEVTKLKSLVESEVEPVSKGGNDVGNDGTIDFATPVVGETESSDNAPSIDFSAAEIPGNVSPIESPNVTPLGDETGIPQPVVELKDRRFESLFRTGR